MRPSKQFIALGIVTAAFFLVLATAPGVTAGSKTSSTTQKSSSSQIKKLTKKPTHAASIPTGKININKANLDTLTQLKGIGPEKAKAILDYRKKVGSFKKVEDLMQVKGIGEKTFKAIKPFIKVK